MESTQNKSNMLMAAEVELVYKSKVKASDRPKITLPQDAYRIFRNSWNEMNWSCGNALRLWR